MSRQLNVLSLQPWYGGSHRDFNDGWISHSRHVWETIGLPGENWKWRMRFAAIELTQKVRDRAAAGRSWDAVVCTDMLNVAELKSLSRSIRDLPIVCYFHENQFAYPNRGAKKPDHHFLFTNFVSAIAADAIWFNSAFNLTTLTDGIEALSSQATDFDSERHVELVKAKARVMPPGISIPELDFQAVAAARRQRVESGEPLRLLWAARWEYDKNPDDLLRTLDLLAQQKVPFVISVLGEESIRIPESMTRIKTRYQSQVINWGYQQSRGEYWRVLTESDVILSTADHEFFGVSVAEAIAAGCWPLLPNRQAYPEAIAATGSAENARRFLYPQTAKQLATKIRQLHQNRNWDWDGLSTLSAAKQALRWGSVAEAFDSELEKWVR